MVIATASATAPARSARPSPAPPLAVEVRGVRKSFRQPGQVVDALGPVDLTVADGEFVCLVGPSGCGKSSLLGIVCGLEQPSAGTVLFRGQPVVGPSPERILLFQEAALFPWLDVQGNVAFALRERGVPRGERAALVQHYLGLVHLGGSERSFVHQLSGGMRQRVAIARALAMDPGLLLMDEPFGALDALTRDRLHGELETLWARTGKTILFVTHNVREAVALGDRVLVLSPAPGRVVAELRIDLPRPRSLQDHALADRARDILAVLAREGER